MKYTVPNPRPPMTSLFYAKAGQVVRWKNDLYLVTDAFIGDRDALEMIFPGTKKYEDGKPYARLIISLEGGMTYNPLIETMVEVVEDV